MSDGYVRLHGWLVRRRWAVLAFLAVVIVAGLLGSSRLRLNEDFTAMLPLSHPAIAEHFEALKHVRQAERLFVDVQTTHRDPERLTQAADRMHAALQDIPGLGDLRYLVEAPDMRAMVGELQVHLPMLLASNELRALETKLSPTALEQRLAWLKKGMAQPQGLFLKEVSLADPAGLGDAVAARLRALQAGVGDAQIVAGRLTSADGQHVLISATPAWRPGELGSSGPMVEAAVRAMRAVEAEYPDGTVRMAMTGAHRVALDNATIIRNDTTLTSGIATVAVAALMCLAYRRRWLAFLGLLPTLFGALGGLSVFWLTSDPVSAVALGCGSILIGVTVDYGIYVLYHTDDAPPSGSEQRARAVAQLVPTLTFGALTTMAAFLAMCVSPVSGHRQLGLFGAVSVALAAFFAIVVLPLLVPVGTVHPSECPGSASGSRAGRADAEAGEAGSARRLPLTRGMQRLFDWRRRRSRVVLPLLLIASALCLGGVLRLRFDGDVARLNGVSPETRHDEAVVRDVWGKALSLTTVVATGATWEEALQMNERIGDALRTLQAEREIDFFSSIAPLFPSEPTRRANVRAWQAFWTADRRHDLRDSLARAAGNLGFRPDAFAPFLERLAAPADPAAFGLGVTTSALGRLARDYWSVKDGRVSVCTLVKTTDPASFPRLRDAIHRAAPGALLLNRAALSDELSRIAKRALPLFAALVTALNVVLLLLLLGRVELVLITLLPMAAGMFWTLGTLGWMGRPIDMANFIFAIFVIGVGGDYSLFLVMAELEPLRGAPERGASTGGAVTICAGTTLLGVGVLVLAQHPAMFSIGLSALLGIGFTLLATLFLVPPCMARLRQSSAGGILCAPPGETDDPVHRRRRIGRLYRYHGTALRQFVFWKLKTDPLFSAVDAATPRPARILDWGCGHGLVAHWLTVGAPGRTVHGVDWSAEKIRAARATARENPRVTFEHGDILGQTPDAHWDVVLLCDVLHYSPTALKAEMLAKAFRALRPGGCLIVRDACRDAARAHRWVVWSERLAVWIGHHRTEHGLHFETAAGYRALLERAGFVRIRACAAAGLGSNAMLAAIKPPGETRVPEALPTDPPLPG